MCLSGERHLKIRRRRATPRAGVHGLHHGPDARRHAALLDRAGHPDDVIVLDALHLYRSDGTAADVIAAPANRLHYLQLCDGPIVAGRMSEGDAMQEARIGRLLPGDGQLPV